MPATLKDIANDLGVSVVTVSKVLRNHSDIGVETRQRVLRRMKELNYRPNPAARALVSGKTHIIGLVVPDLINSFFAQVAKGLSGVFRKKGYSLIISSSEEDPALEREEIDQMLARRVDSLIVASSQWSGESIRKLEEQRTPYILLDRRFEGLQSNFVGVDDEAVGALATGHLIANGCRRIAHIGGRDVSTAIGRLEGYRRALESHQMATPPEYVTRIIGGNDEGDETGYVLMKDLLKIEPRPDSVFCYNDPAAFGAMKAIIEAGLRIPEDIAVVGCGNVKYADFLRVPLTSIDQNIETIGERAAKLAISLVESKNKAKPRSILLEPKLIVRQSSLKNG